MKKKLVAMMLTAFLAAASFAYPSLDVHKEYYGWYTSTRKGLAEGMEGIYDSKEIASTFTYMKR